MTDDELYLQYLAGDTSAGDQLMLRYGDTLTAYLDGFVHHPQDAEDLMLDCFAVILVGKPEIREGNFRAYLFRIARNKVNRLWRVRLRRQEFTPDDTLASPDQNPEDTALKNERSEALNRCLNRIAPQYREALWLVYVMEMSYAQVALAQECSVIRVQNLVENGKKQLRRELEKEGITNADA